MIIVQQITATMKHILLIPMKLVLYLPQDLQKLKKTTLT